MRLPTIRRPILIAGLLTAVAVPALANHSWNNYHWPRTRAQITVRVGDNVGGNWDSFLRAAVADWNRSTVIESPLVAGSTSYSTCKAVAGTIQVCNSAYGRTGWLGIASISLTNGHISQGTTKLNDTYFNTAQYNTFAWRSLVMCQELGHDYGLDHQDEDSATDTTRSCMDYTNRPAGNEHPDAHDYAQLEAIYNHLESSTVAGSVQSSAPSSTPGETPAQWGRATRFTKDGRPNRFERVDGPGKKTVTHVFWAIDEGPRRAM